MDQITLNKILNHVVFISEENFFLNLAIKLDLNYQTTKHQILDIHRRICTGEKNLNDYSQEIQKLYKHYLEYLRINIDEM